ncbi:hypothetical protein RM572_00475 [Streptomyces sp. DSM 42041]|uniref:Amino acid:DNA transferase domain-containing protein n=1 Tax=Streptomyces hazeniae TaxID=3075538 RepID=A0ABU2NJS9_9ACTN|nr:hypothetical protein [Streptomyces sp. DSM 42041]MDT0377251.1 hypothetical protein [Streptomyces sp. DSM 42041]
MTGGWALWDDYTRFHQAAVDSRDIDPVYPVLAHLAATEGWDEEATTRAILLHVAYYDFGSALTAAHLHLNDEVPFSRLPTALPCATERRSHRQPAKLAAHLTALDLELRTHGTARGWLGQALHGHSRRADFEHLARHAARVHGNGRWAAYKTAEMLWKVAGWPVTAATLAMDSATGPRQGLALLAGRRPLTEATAQELCADLASARLPAGPEEVETTLCDFHALHSGAYYVGHDIDQMQAQLSRAHTTPLTPAAWQARAATLPHPYLGELNGWTGVDRRRKRAYADTGRILTRSHHDHPHEGR